MKNQELIKQQNSKEISVAKNIRKRKPKSEKKVMNGMPLYITFLLVILLPTIASLLQTGQINMAVNVTQGLAICVLIIKMAIDRK